MDLSTDKKNVMEKFKDYIKIFKFYQLPSSYEHP